MSEQLKPHHVKQFKAWQERPPERQPLDERREPLEYTCHWGEGCRKIAIVSAEFTECISMHVWRPHAQVYQPDDLKPEP